MDKIIKTLCQSLIKEADAVITCTEGLKLAFSTAGAEEAERTFALNRLDAVEHIQNLTITLTTLLSGSTVKSDE